MQQLKTADETAPKYSGSTVRDVLARAAQIEEEQQTEAMTAEQIETLGRELGLSPESVRRSLQEKTGQNTAAVSVVEPVTQAAKQAKTAYLPLVLPLMLSIVAIYGSLAGAFDAIGVERSLAAVTLMFVNLFLAAYLVARAGWIRKGIVTYTVTGLYVPFFITFANETFNAASYALSRYSPNYPLDLLIFAIGGALTAAAGAYGRRWWDNLPRNVSRKAASHR